MTSIRLVPSAVPAPAAKIETLNSGHAGLTVEIVTDLETGKFHACVTGLAVDGAQQGAVTGGLPSRDAAIVAARPMVRRIARWLEVRNGAGRIGG